MAAVVLLVWTTKAERWVVHTIEVKQLNLRLLATAQLAESGERGYIITHDGRFLTRFREAQTLGDHVAADLERAIADNPPQAARVKALRKLVQEKREELDDTVRIADTASGAEVETIVQSHLQNDLMGQIYRASEAIDQGEEELLGRRTREAARARVLLGAAILILLPVGTALAYFVIRSLRAHLRQSEEHASSLDQEMQRREAAEGRIRQTQKMEALGQLTGGVAHDFNNMLAIIVGNLDMLLRRSRDADSRSQRLVENALESARRAAALTHRLLAFSRLQPLAPRPIDINRCVQDMAEMLQRTLGEHVKIEAVLGAGVWHANIDLPQLESAILNLAVNARDAMPSGGKLTIETSNTFLDRSYAELRDEVNAGQYVLIAVTDTGQGMTAEVLTKAFDPFFTTKPVGSGTGLGLSQVQGFIKQSGGHVALYSELGVGTTVKMYLPRYSGTLSAAVPSVDTGSIRDHEDITVLVVEDEEGVRRFVVEALRELRYSVVQAQDGAAALAIIESNRDIDILLTDIVMPGMDGRRLADQALKLRSEIKVLYMTGYTRNAIVHNGVLDEGTHLLTKPFTLNQLQEELDALLSRASTVGNLT